ncbi:MAG: lipopolysaccharide kinase InaA family protein [Pseudoflavonifractor sp.]|nr:lipopolysaccharide kinase InaA family protein [Alloprevotella sp.]MCM1116942.1 lipopolysaccharide kinase InaA family protein [Pseudoflavonifractor sp.]
MTATRKITIQYSPRGEEIKTLVEQVAREGMPSGATILFTGRNTVAAVDTPTIRVNIKSFALPNVINRYVYGHLRVGKAQRSFINSHRLLALGFKVPTPLAFAEERGPLRFYRSYFFSEHMEGLTEMRHPETHPFLNELLDALGQEMARLHRAGVWMKDFSPGNVLFRRNGDTGSFDFYYVDLNRIAFDEHRSSRLDHMWERLLFDPGQLKRAIKAYAAAMGTDPDLLTVKALSLHEAYRRRKKL